MLPFDAWNCHGITKFLFFFLRVVIWVIRCIFLIAWNCHGLLCRGIGKCFFLLLVVVMGLESASFCCCFDNKAHGFRSCHGIIIVMGLESASF